MDMLQTPDPTLVQGDMNLLFAGTTFWGRYTNEMARATEQATIGARLDWANTLRNLD